MVSTQKLVQEINLTIAGLVTPPSRTNNYKRVIAVLEVNQIFAFMLIGFSSFF